MGQARRAWLGVAERLALLLALGVTQQAGSQQPWTAAPPDAATLWHAQEADEAQPAITPDSVGPAAVTAQEVWRGLCQTGAPQVPVVEMTIAEAHSKMLAGRHTCGGLVAAYLQRMEAFDQRMQLRSIRDINPSVAQRAAELDVELALMRANGTTVLPSMFCVPMLVKDNLDVAGMATMAGLADNLPLADAHVISRMQQRGALVLAKTAMGEFAFFPSFCLSSTSGVVRNPYSLSHSPAGSSGGSAAACAANLGMVALGTDTGNSVRGPASHTALVGLRPSLGLVSRTGLVPLRMDRDTAGPMARTVEDAVRVLEAIAGPDPADPMTTLLKNISLPPNASYTQFLVPGGLAGARIGVLRQISSLPGADVAIQLLFERALGVLRQAGATLEEDFRIRGNSLGLDWDANRGGEGPAIGHWNVRDRWEDLWACQSPFREGLDSYLAAGNTSMRYRSLSDIYQAGVYHLHMQDEILAALRAPYLPSQYPTPAMQAMGMVCGCSFFWEDPCRSEFRTRLVESMDADQVEALVYPTWNLPPLRVGDSGDNGDGYNGNNSPMIAPHTGSPAITVPMGYTGQGLPAGLQFLGRPFDEAAVIRLAYGYEQATRHRRPPPLFPECHNQGAGVTALTNSSAG